MNVRRCRLLRSLVADFRRQPDRTETARKPRGGAPWRRHVAPGVASGVVFHVVLRTGVAARCAAIAALALAPLLVSPPDAAAQFGLGSRRTPVPRTFDVAVIHGTLFSTDWSDLVLLGSVSSATGAFEQIVLRDVAVDPGPVTGFAVTYWEGRGAVRLTGAFSKSCLTVGASCVAPLSPFDPLPSPKREIEVRTWMVDLGGMVNLRDVGPRDVFRPFLYVGFGAVAYDPDPDAGRVFTGFLDARRTVDAGNGLFIVTFDDATQFLLAVDELGFSTEFALNLAVGLDLQLPLDIGAVGLRLEASDHITASPVDLRLIQIEDDGFRRWDDELRDARLDFGPVHNFRLTAGLTIGIGLSDKVPNDRWWW